MKTNPSISEKVNTDHFWVTTPSKKELPSWAFSVLKNLGIQQQRGETSQEKAASLHLRSRGLQSKGTDK